MAEPGTLDILTQAEKKAASCGSATRLMILDSREVVRRSLQSKCARSFRKQSGISTYVGNLTVYIPFGVMVISDANGTQAHKCPNPDSCPKKRRRRMRPIGANKTTEFKDGSCPLLLAAIPGSSDDATDGGPSVCGNGFDPASPGCAKCASGFGRKNTDPFSCQLCGKLSSTGKTVAALSQPLILFILSLRSANLAASKGMAESLANDMVKIILAYLSSVGAVISAVTSTDSYRGLNATDRAREILNLTQQTAQHGDVTYSFSNDCLLMDGQGAASVDQLLAFSLLLPVCVLVVTAILVAVHDGCRTAFSGDTLGLDGLRAKAVERMITFSLVAGNQFLPSVASACMRVVPCFHTQATSGSDVPSQFMSYDVDGECNMASTPYLMTCGPVLVLAVVAGPVWWLSLLRREQSAQLAGPVRFLTGSYRDGFHWWEAGRLCKTMLIASVVTASPVSYCPLQQLMLCLIITVAYGFWHCSTFPYKNLVVNVAEAGSLLILSSTMGLSGLLAGANWPLTPSFRSKVVIGILMTLVLYFFALVGLWVRFKFFWVEDTGEELVVADSRDDGRRDSTAA
jgi:hypothetical protein